MRPARWVPTGSSHPWAPAAVHMDSCSNPPAAWRSEALSSAGRLDQTGGEVRTGEESAVRNRGIGQAALQSDSPGEEGFGSQLLHK